MKIAVVLPSRGHPVRLHAVITALDHLASGQHEVSYHVVADDDDDDTQAMGKGPKPWIHMHSGPTTIGLHARINNVVRVLVIDLYVDAVTFIADDTFPLAMNWDARIAGGIEQGLCAFAWQELNDPQNVTYPVLSRIWLKTLGYAFPEWFPFWFADTWIASVHQLAFAKSFPIVQNLSLGGKRGKTRGLRDLKF